MKKSCTLRPCTLRQGVIAASLLFACGSVHAIDNVFAVGSLQTYASSTYINLVNHIAPSEPVGTIFTDYFNFSTTGTAGSSVATTLTLGSYLDISGLSVSLYNGSGPIVGTLVAGPVGTGVTLTASLLTNTPYTVAVSGTTSGAIGGSYSTAISAVPETDTWAMMIAGLGLMGLRLRRRMGGTHSIRA